MIPRVDWLSFTYAGGLSPIPIGPTYAQRTINKTILSVPDPVAAIVAASDFEERGGKNFYRHWLHRIGGGCDIFSSPDREDVLVELSGIGCAMFPAEEDVLSAVKPVDDSVTRIDLAADFYDPLSPFTFAYARTNNRFRRLSTDASDTGETVYVGSRSSDKYARVYRYAPPHPRHEYLRVEMVYKRKQAKETAAYLVMKGIAHSVIAAGNYYGWNHPLWTDAATHDFELKSWKPDTGAPDTVRWLLTQVLPAMRKLERDGVIEDIDAFMAAHLRNEEGGQHAAD